MSATRIVALGCLLALGSASAAGAACGDQLGQLEDRVANLDTSGSQQQSASVSTSGGGEVQVEGTAEGSEPQETWMGNPPTPENAKEQIKNARVAADNGNEDMCQQHVEQARKMIEALEGGQG